MADALPPQSPQVQLETLKAFKRDLEMAVRTKAKGLDSQPVQMVELRLWLSAALASNTDEARGPLEGPGMGFEGFLGPKDKKQVLKALGAKVDARIALLEGGGGEPVATQAWLAQELVGVSEKAAKVPVVKGGETRAATVSEIREWLGVAAPVQVVPVVPTEAADAPSRGKKK